MKLYLRANKVTDTNEKIIAVLGRFQGGTAGAFAQQKLDKLDRGATLQVRMPLRQNYNWYTVTR